jgi:circadian clock protein KaiC
VLYFVFDETIETMVDRSKQIGMDLAPLIAAGTFIIQQIDPAEITPGELAHRIRLGVERENVRVVVIDSINGYLNAMPADRFLNLQLHELLAYLNQQGVLTMMVLAQQGLIGAMHSAVDLTYLADAVVFLRYFEDHGTVKQAVSVIKKRSGSHERTIREFKMDRGGISVGEPLVDLQGVLTGVPRLAVPPSARN